LLAPPISAGVPAVELAPASVAGAPPTLLLPPFVLPEVEEPLPACAELAPPRSVPLSPAALGWSVFSEPPESPHEMAATNKIGLTIKITRFIENLQNEEKFQLGSR
jgi:hypothetical protein